MAQSVKRPTLAQVLISRFVSLSPASGSVLTAQSLDGACFGFCLLLSLLLSCFTLSLSKINIKKKNDVAYKHSDMSHDDAQCKIFFNVYV